MNLQQLMPIFTQLLGKDYTPEVNSFFRCRAAVGNALTPAGQTFVINNWKNVADFLESTKGHEATQAFITAWTAYLNEVSTPKEPSEQVSASGT